MVVLCHPRKGSFNHAIAQKAAQSLRETGREPRLHDLYNEGFDPVLSETEMQRRFSFDDSVQHYATALSEAEGIVIVHPDWWGQPPALLKGWVDRVFRPGIAYDFDEIREKEALLRGKKATVFITTNFKEDEGPHVLELLWKERVFKYCGVRDIACRTFYDTHQSRLAQRNKVLEEVADVLHLQYLPHSSGPSR
jgi:putative NADPH-quinone reductase